LHLACIPTAWLHRRSHNKTGHGLYRRDVHVLARSQDSLSLQWGYKLSEVEGIIPAIETAHAFAVLDKMDLKASDVVVINCSGRGDKDLNTYIEYKKKMNS
ncbi:MAG: hypothetical protein AAFP83_05900, partial [Bacteroidota bacterium]